MAYYLGVDLGTTYTAAAIWRNGRVEIASLGNRAPVIPSVMLLREDEEILTGEAAARRATTEPERVAREFKRRIGDPTPIIVGGAPYSAAALTGRLLRSVVDKVTESEGGPPDGIAVSHPANWTDFKTDLLRQAIQVADLDGVTLLTEPEAAAIHYASLERVEPGAVVAVYDLGGGTFDAAVLRKTADGFELLGEPQGIERLGGVDFDEAVFQHVVRATDGAVLELDADSPAALAAVARLRQDCVEAKEALSADTDVSIPVLLPNLRTDVRLTRTEFEQLIRPPLADSITSMSRALRSAGVTADDVSAVLLVGGSSRIPLVAQMVGAELGRPVAVDAHPKHGIALGAAIVAAEAAGAAGSAPEATVVAGAAVAEEPTVAMPVVAETAAMPVVPPPVPPPAPTTDPGGRDGRRVGLLVGGALVVIALVVVLAIVLTGGDDGDGETVAAGETTSAPSSAPSTTAVPSSTPEASTTVPATTVPPTTAAPTTTAPTTTASTAPPTTLPTGPYARPDEVVLEDGRYRVNYEVFNFTPSLADGELHVHFFLNPPTEPEDAGTNGNPPGEWDLTDDPSTFLTFFGPSDAEAGSEMCMVVATSDHAVFDPDSGECVELPA
jgi:molecular chaperone DnaK